MLSFYFEKIYVTKTVFCLEQMKQNKV